jgi:hypothetical protein
LSRAITIFGPGASTLDVARDPSSSDDFGIFTVESGETVSILNLSISGGYLPSSSGAGAGILNYGILNISFCTVSNSDAGFDGGGIENFGTAKVSSSSFSGSGAGAAGGGVNNDGTITRTLPR